VQGAGFGGQGPPEASATTFLSPDMTTATPISNIINTNNLPNSFRNSLRSVIISPYSLIVNLQCKPERCAEPNSESHPNEYVPIPSRQSLPLMAWKEENGD
jgi:hypothetical protein